MAGEQNRFELSQGCPFSFFNDFHVGILSSKSKTKKRPKSEKLRALLTYIYKHVEVRLLSNSSLHYREASKYLQDKLHLCSYGITYHVPISFRVFADVLLTV
jgi:hypothetical protein